jgi:threonine dehydratase
MSRLDPAAIQAAAVRLKGHLVATPLVGAVRLPGFAVGADLRLKPEVLQPGGSLWYRGSEHFLLRKLGACKGLTLCGDVRAMLATAVAAQEHRVPVEAFCEALPAADLTGQLRELGCAVRVVTGALAAAQAQQRREGTVMMPGPGDVDFDLGIATVGLELAQSLPAECARVFVAAAFASAVDSGLVAGGRVIPVVPAGADVPAGLGAALLAGHRLAGGDWGLSALAQALAEGAGVMAVVLAG